MLAIVLFGASFYFKKRTANDFITGGGKLPSWAIGMSIFATFVSSISFLALPGNAYLSNWNGFVFSLSIPIAAILAVKFFVPLYRGIKSASAYYYLENAWLEKKELPKSFPDITIVGHWNFLNPGESLWLSAAITNGYEGNLTYSWEVYDQNWEKSIPIANSKVNGKFVEIILPASPSRAYLYAKDANGNVITASRILLITHLNK